MSQRKRDRKSRELPRVHPAAAAIDIGATMHVAAVGPDRDQEPVRTFRTFTEDLHRLADWFAECGVKTVVMESTGVYWIPVFEILEQRGFEVMVVNARDAKHVPGRKTDVSDAEWLQRLHEYGLLRPSFRPQAEIAGLRAYLRQRERLQDYAAGHIQHMQKALMQMNLQLHHVVSDITGVTGMAIVRAIVAGERDPTVLASHRDRRCHASVETVCQALIGNYREEHVFALTQALELYEVYQTKVMACDKQIEAILTRLRQAAPRPVHKLPPARRRGDQKNAPAFDARAALHAILGVDLTQINGLGPYLALKLVGGMRHQPRGMADGEALHLMARSRAAQQDFRWEGGDRLIAILDGRADPPEKRKQLQVLINDSIDVDGIAHFALGRFWNTASDRERKEYVRLFPATLSENFGKAFGGYRGVRFSIDRAWQADSEVKVSTTVFRPDYPMQVTWVVGSVGGTTKIVDILAAGVSMRITQRDGCNTMLAHNNNSIQALIETLLRQTGVTS